MLVLKLEVFPQGIERHKKLIGLGRISNDRTGTTEEGNYTVELVHEGKALRTKVRGFRRKDCNGWELVYEALKAVYGPAEPVLTAEQKLEIRNAQVVMFQAKRALESTPQYKAFVEAQDKMNQVALRIERESGADPKKWQFTQDLEYVPVPEKK